MERGTLVQRRSKRAMETVLEIELIAVFDDVSEEVAVEGGILREQHLQVERAFGGDEVVQSHQARRHVGPLSRGQPVIGVRARVADGLEDHDGHSSGPLDLGP